MARITALARALKASGAGGGIDLLRSHVYLGLLLGTLPYIPPPADAPPDQTPDNDDSQPGGEPPGGEPPGGEPPGGSQCGDGFPGGEPRDGEPPGEGLPRGRPGRGRAPDGGPDRDARGTRHQDRDTPPAEHGNPRNNNHDDHDDHDDDARARPPPAWPQVLAFLQPGPAAMNHLTPATSAGGLLDLRLPWTTLTGHSPHPGHLNRLGPITPSQARHLAHLAATDPTVRWRIILTNPHGHATATTALPRKSARPATGHQAGLIKQITITIGPGTLTGPHPHDLPPALHRILTTARTLAARAAEQTAHDTQAAGGCAHTGATTAYRPTTRLRDYITARDLTCRFTTWPPARHPLRHRPHHPLPPRRTHLLLQPRRIVPVSPSGQGTSRLAPGAGHLGHLSPGPHPPAASTPPNPTPARARSG